MKFDDGKEKLTLVPRDIIHGIARVREYGVKKYGDPDNWKSVEENRYRDAAFRHFLKYLDDPYGVDSESGIPHIYHLACNIAFLCEFYKEHKEDTYTCTVNQDNVMTSKDIEALKEMHRQMKKITDVSVDQYDPRL